MQTIISNPWFVLIVAVIGVVGALASVSALRKRKPTQRVAVGGATTGTIEQRASSPDQPAQEIEVQGEVHGVIRQTQE